MSTKITPQSDSNLDVTVTESDNLVSLDIQPASFIIAGSGLGTVTQVSTGTGLTGGPITSTGTLAIDSTVATLDGAQALTNKTGLISQWTNDAGYITNAEDDQTLTFANPDLTISNGNTVDITMYDQTLNTTDDVTFNSVTADMYGVQHFIAKAREAISAGQPVYISGHSGNTPEVMVADYTDPAKMPAFGIASADIANNNNGDISTAGDLKNVDTTGTSSGETWAVGDNLYVNGSKLTNVRPQLETQAVQSLAKVIRVHANNGQMFLSGAGRVNDTPNLDHYHVFIGNAGGVEERQLTYTDILNTPTIPTNNNQLTNGAGYTTNTGTVTPTSTDTFTNKSGAISQWTNDAGYLTSETDNQTLSFANPNLSISSGNSVDLSALTPTSLAWSAITSTPTTIAGYGITDAFDGAYSSLSGLPTLYDDAAVNAHLNTVNANPQEVLTWSGTDWAWTTLGAVATSNDYDDLDNRPTINNTTINNNADNRLITGSNTADTLEGESNFTWDGTNAVIDGEATDLTTPVLHLKTANSAWFAGQLMCSDSNGKVFTQVGRHNTGADYYQWNITLDPDNTNGRTGVTTFAGDYFVSFEKNYSTASDIRMDMNIYGAHQGFNITVRDDYNNGGGNQYGMRPLNLNALETNINAGGNGDLVFTANDTGITFGDNSYTFPLSDGTANQVLTTNGSGSITFEDAGGLTASTTPTLGGAATGFQGLNYVVTVSNYNTAYVPGSQFRLEITKDSDSSVVNTPQDFTDNGDGTFTVTISGSAATGAHTVRVKGQDFNKGESAEATMTLDISAISFTKRYWRLKDFDGGPTGSAGNTSIQIMEFQLFSSASQAGTKYPTNMSTNTAPTPFVASGQGYYAPSGNTYNYYRAFDGNSINSYYWNLSGDMTTDYLAIDLGSAQTIESFSFKSGPTAGNAGKFALFHATQSDFSDEELVQRFEFTTDNQTITFG